MGNVLPGFIDLWNKNQWLVMRIYEKRTLKWLKTETRKMHVKVVSQINNCRLHVKEFVRYWCSSAHNFISSSFGILLDPTVQSNFYKTFGSGITSTIRCNPHRKRRCQPTLDQAQPLSTGSGFENIIDQGLLKTILELLLPILARVFLLAPI